MSFSTELNKQTNLNSYRMVRCSFLHGTLKKPPLMLRDYSRRDGGIKVGAEGKERSAVKYWLVSMAESMQQVKSSEAACNGSAQDWHSSIVNHRLGRRLKEHHKSLLKC